jgi:hypothetical protein
MWASGGAILAGMAFRRHLDGKRMSNIAVEKVGSLSIQKQVQVGKKRRSTMFQRGNIGNDLNGTADVKQMKKYLHDYVNSLMPSVFNTRSMLVAIKEELQKNHAYFKLFWRSSSDPLPTFDICQLLTNLTASFFLLALLYDLQSPPDDGSCPSYTTSSACTERKSFLDDNQSFCRWDGTNCIFNPVEINTKIVLYCTIVVSLFSAIMMYPVDYLISILQAELNTSIFTKIPHPSGNHSKVVDEPITFNQIVPSEPSTNNSKEMTDNPVETFYISESTLIAQRKARLSMMAMVNSLSQQRSDPRWFEDIPSSSLISFLARDVLSTRSRLMDDRTQLTQFDSYWGLDPATQNFKYSQTSNDDKQVTELRRLRRLSVVAPLLDNAKRRLSVVAPMMNDTKSSLVISTKQLIELELFDIHEEAKEHAERLKGLPDTHVGIELLQLFVQDLLGKHTPAAKVFRFKLEEDCAKVATVSLQAKILASVGLAGLNFFFVYYSILRGYQHGVQWQYSFLLAAILQTVQEVLFGETIQCIYVHYLLPEVLSRQVIGKVHIVLSHCIEALCEEQLDLRQEAYAWESRILQSLTDKSAYQSAQIVNAPQYLFVSTQLARHYPMLVESMLILAYRNILPGEISWKWRADLSISRPSVGAFLTRDNMSWYIKVIAHLRHVGTLLMTLLLTSSIHFLSFAPFSLQKFIVRFFEPMVVGGIVLTWLMIAQTWLGIFLFSVAITIIIIGAIYRHLKKKGTPIVKPDSHEEIIKVMVDSQPSSHSDSSASTAESEQNDFPIPNKCESRELVANFSLCVAKFNESKKEGRAFVETESSISSWNLSSMSSPSSREGILQTNPAKCAVSDDDSPYYEVASHFISNIFLSSSLFDRRLSESNSLNSMDSAEFECAFLRDNESSSSDNGSESTKSGGYSSDNCECKGGELSSEENYRLSNTDEIGSTALTCDDDDFM